VKLAAKRLADLVDAGRSLADAAGDVLEEVGPGAGLIALTDEGDVAIVRNTPFMSAAERH
jgi:isoaspartyl peptidase/L-asparaginase-like protein (Ntn-hydrolase superfamily)